MKNRLSIPAILLILIMYSCGSKEQKQDSSAGQSSLSEMMKEHPAYDATKIDPAAKVVEITLRAQGNSMTDMKYDQSELHVPAGCTVKLKLINEGTDAAMEHNFVLIENGTADNVAKAGLAAGPSADYLPSIPDVFIGTKVTKPKTEADITFPAPEKGNYEFICTYPGHYQKMHGKFFVD
jgi:azurin